MNPPPAFGAPPTMNPPTTFGAPTTMNPPPSFGAPPQGLGDMENTSATPPMENGAPTMGNGDTSPMGNEGTSPMGNAGTSPMENKTNTTFPKVGGRKSKKNNRNKGRNKKKRTQKGGGFLDDINPIGKITSMFSKGEEEHNEANEIPNPLQNESSNSSSADLSEIAKRPDGRTITEFIEFVDKNKMPKTLILPEGEIKIDRIPKNYSKSSHCLKSGNDINSKTFIYTENGPFKEFKGIYDEFKKHYMGNKKRFLDILQDKILEVDKKNKKYKIRNFNSKELMAIEKEVRTSLVNYYMKCQTFYREGYKSVINSIDDYMLLEEKRKMDKDAAQKKSKKQVELNNE